jgi:hypothetical protein
LRGYKKFCEDSCVCQQMRVHNPQENENHVRSNSLRRAAFVSIMLVRHFQVRGYPQAASIRSIQWSNSLRGPVPLWHSNPFEAERDSLYFPRFSSMAWRRSTVDTLSAPVALSATSGVSIGGRFLRSSRGQCKLYLLGQRHDGRSSSQQAPS